MWSTCNVGADKPEEYGLLFQFGRVDGYKYGDENNQFRTYEQNKQDTGDENIPKTTSGKVYNEDDILDLEDDAARVNMGGIWRMPTKDELQELLDNTSHEVTSINEVQGMMFTSNINGKQLFIPFAGYWYEEEGFTEAGSNASVWSSLVLSYDINSADVLDCYSGGDADITDYYRSFAFSVRGVFKTQE